MARRLGLFLYLVLILVPHAYCVSMKAPPSVVKQGDILTITPEQGPPLILKGYGNEAQDDREKNYRNYSFYKYFEETGHVLICESEYEWGENLMVSLKTGTSFYIHGNGTMEPVLSPDHARFSIYSSNEAEEANGLPRYSIRIWKFVNDSGVLEDKVIIDEGADYFGMMKWTDNSTIEITMMRKNSKSRTILIRRHDQKWDVEG